MPCYLHSHGALLALVLLVALSPRLAAQNVSGTVVTADAGPVSGVNVVIDGTFIGRATDIDGRFSLPVDFSAGARVLRFSYTGYETQRVTVEGPTDDLLVTLQPEVLQGGGVVVSASRQAESVLTAPVTVERVSLAQLQRQPATEIIASMDRLKGIDVSRSSMLISSLSTRGFNSAKSERVIQLIDGVDFLTPTLSLYVGNLTGVPEIDMEGVEIVYGANSALYGANAFNGVVLFQTKDPFLYTGPSFTARTGERGLVEAQARWAQKVNDRFAYKLVGSFFEADDYIATNFSTLTTIADNFNADGSVRAPGDPRGADLVNRYGEAVVVSSGTVINAGGTTLGDLGLEGSVFSPGFSESDLVLNDYRARSMRVAGTASYLLTDAVKATASLRYGQGNGIYQSSNRYAFDGISGTTASLDLEGADWTVRGYVNDAGDGDTYDLGFLGSFMNLQPFQDQTTGEMIMVPVDPANPAGRAHLRDGLRPDLCRRVRRSSPHGRVSRRRLRRSGSRYGGHLPDAGRRAVRDRTQRHARRDDARGQPALYDERAALPRRRAVPARLACRGGGGRRRELPRDAVVFGRVALQRRPQLAAHQPGDGRASHARRCLERGVRSVPPTPESLP